MCLREKNFPEKTAYAFLEDMKENFLEKISIQDYKEAIPNGLNARFRDTIKSRMEYYRKNPEDIDKLSLLRKTLNESKNEILRTDDILSERSEKLNLIVNKAEEMKTESRSYYDWVFYFFFNFLISYLLFILSFILIFIF
jgi:hypothetical protein